MCPEAKRRTTYGAVLGPYPEWTEEKRVCDGEKRNSHRKGGADARKTRPRSKKRLPWRMEDGESWTHNREVVRVHSRNCLELEALKTLSSKRG